MLGVQDGEFTDGSRKIGDLARTLGGRGIAFNHNPNFYLDDDTLMQGVRLHANVAYDDLTGTITPDS